MLGIHAGDREEPMGFKHLAEALCRESGSITQQTRYPGRGSLVVV